MTPNANVTPCATAPTFTPTYDFSNGVQCWVVDAYTQSSAGGGMTCVSGIGTSSVIQHGGHSVLCLTINNSSAATVKAQVEVVWGTTGEVNFGGAAATAYVTADASLLTPSLSSGTMGAVIFAQGPTYNFDTGTYTALNSTAGTWTMITGSTFTTTNAIQFGVQVYNIAPGAKGNIYISDVNVALPTSPTSTPTSTPTPYYEWTYEDNATDSWYVNYGPSNSLAVTTLGYNSSYGLNMVFGGGAGGNEFQAASNGTPPTFPLNFTTLNITGISAYMNPDPSCFTGGNGAYNVAACPFLVAGTGGTYYGGCYNGWNGADAQYGPSGLGSGTWYQVNWPLSKITAAGWTTDETDVTKVGFDVNMVNSVASTVTVDDINVY